MITNLPLLNPCLFKKTAYITVRKDYLRKSQAELRTENFANQRFYQLVVFAVSGVASFDAGSLQVHSKKFIKNFNVSRVPSCTLRLSNEGLTIKSIFP